MIDAEEMETAFLIKRFLRLPAFRTKAKRCGKVFRLSPNRVIWWETGNPLRQHLIW
jgi:hypothetical protein